MFQPLQSGSLQLVLADEIYESRRISGGNSGVVSVVAPVSSSIKLSDIFATVCAKLRYAVWLPVVHQFYCHSLYIGGKSERVTGYRAGPQRSAISATITTSLCPRQ